MVGSTPLVARQSRPAGSFPIGVGGYRPVLRNVTFAPRMPGVWSVSNRNADGPGPDPVGRPFILRPQGAVPTGKEQSNELHHG